MRWFVEIPSPETSTASTSSRGCKEASNWSCLNEQTFSWTKCFKNFYCFHILIQTFEFMLGMLEFLTKLSANRLIFRNNTIFCCLNGKRVIIRKNIHFQNIKTPY